MQKTSSNRHSISQRFSVGILPLLAVITALSLLAAACTAADATPSVFEYPTGFSVVEMPFPGRDAVSAEAGMAQFQLLSYPFELVEAVWVQAEPDADLKAHLAGFVESASQQAGVAFTVGELQPFTKDDHQALYQSFDFELQGLRLRGVTVAWTCTKSQRVFLLSYATNPEVSEQDLTARLQAHLDAFACHGAQLTLE